jgi:hypothetical protein
MLLNVMHIAVNCAYLQIFTEKVGADGETQTVQRDPLYADNVLLPTEHAHRVGDKILAYMTEVRYYYCCLQYVHLVSEQSIDC